MKSILPLLVLVSAASFASPGLACEQHQSHAALKTAEQVPAEPVQIVIEPAAQSVPASEGAKAVMSTPSGAAYEGCNRAHKGETVYLTQ